MITTEAPATHDVHAVLEEVWGSFLGDGAPLLPGGPDLPSHAWYAAITVTGEWEALMVVGLPLTLADRVTATMLGLPADEPCSEEDVTDALGELINIVGGGIKSLMPGPSSLSLPLVAQGPVSSTSDLVEVCEIDITWHGEPIRLSIAVPKSSGGTP